MDSYTQGPQFNIRQAGLVDLQILVAIEKEALNMWTEDMIVSDLSDTRKEIYLIYNGEGEAAGYIDIWYGYENDYHILGFGVLEKYRKMGYGGELLNYVVNTAQLRGAAAITLEVKTGNITAIGLYKRFGFEELGIRKFYYKDGSHALIMMLKLG